MRVAPADWIFCSRKWMPPTRGDDENRGNKKGCRDWQPWRVGFEIGAARRALWLFTPKTFGAALLRSCAPALLRSCAPALLRCYNMLSYSDPIPASPFVAELRKSGKENFLKTGDCCRLLR